MRGRGLAGIVRRRRVCTAGRDPAAAASASPAEGRKTWATATPSASPRRGSAWSRPRWTIDAGRGGCCSRLPARQSRSSPRPTSRIERDPLLNW